MLKEIAGLLYKEVLLEWKQKYAFNGLLLYVASMVTVVSTAFAQRMDPFTWTVVFWLIVLFVAINAVARSFMAEQPGQMLYLFQLVRPQSLIIAKMIYNALLLSVVSLAALGAYSFLGGIAVADPLRLAGIVLLGSCTFSANLTLVTAIAARAENRTTLLAVLSFPLLAPALLMLIRLSRPAVEGTALALDSVGLLGGMTFTLAAVSVLLFPAIWRE